jgi:hypothetical protein
MNLSNAQIALMGLALTATIAVGAESAPQELLALATKAQVQGEIIAWCSGSFRQGDAGAFALAVSATSTEGRYLTVTLDGGVFELGTYQDAPELACYTPAEAITLSTTIASSETVQGNIVPLFTTTVVCAFLQQTAATCWQYSPTANVFVQVGSWNT